MTEGDRRRTVRRVGRDGGLFDAHALENYFSVNTLYDADGIAGANGRNTRSPIE